MENVKALMDFGLTKQEANIYILLLLEGELNGYEAAKKSGISRSNAYSALAGLTEKGAAYMMEEDTVKYTPVPVKEFCDNKIRFLKKAQQHLQKNLPQKRLNEEGYITIKGEQQITDKLHAMLRDTKERVYLAVTKERVEEVRELLETLIQAGKKVVVITDEKIFLEGATIYYSENKKEQIRLIIDSTNVLTGEVRDQYNATCLYSRNNNLVEVFKDALANEIKLLEMKKG